MSDDDALKRFADSRYFADCPLATAHEKSQTAILICQFLSAGMRPEDFTPLIFEKLSPLFECERLGIDGFREKWLVSAVSKWRFLTHISEYVPPYDPSESFSDLERFVRNWSVQNVLHRWMFSAERAAYMRERGTLAELLRKHGIPPQFKLPGQ